MDGCLNLVRLAGITQLVECKLPKLDVAGSSPVARSTWFYTGLRLDRRIRCTPLPRLRRICSGVYFGLRIAVVGSTRTLVARPFGPVRWLDTIRIGGVGLTKPAFFWYGPLFLGKRIMAETVTEKLKELARPALAATGLELVDVETAGDQKRLRLRVVVDKPGGVNVDDCAELNRYLSDILDVHDLIEDSYVLEVSSPGLDRPLKTEEHFAWAVGREVRLNLRRPASGRNVVVGELAAFDGRELTLRVGEESRSIPLEDVARARLHVDPFGRGSNHGQGNRK